jgi:hypothetical protein
MTDSLKSMKGKRLLAAQGESFGMQTTLGFPTGASNLNEEKG